MLEVMLITQHKQHTFINKFKPTIDNSRIFVDIRIYIYTYIHTYIQTGSKNSSAPAARLFADR